MSETRIVLADDHPIVRQGLRTLLETKPEYRIVGEAGDGFEAIRLTEHLKPDVLVSDLMMPGLNGMEVVRQVRERARETQVLILSMYSNESYVLEVLRNGAAGFILKDSVASELLHAISEIAAGRRYLNAAISEHTIDAYIGKSKTLPTDDYDTLTSREREVLQLAVQGNSSAKIAEFLSISPRTVETHRAHLMRKLNVRNQSEMIRLAIRRGILPADG